MNTHHNNLPGNMTAASMSYDEDFYAWTVEQAKRLRSSQSDALDLENLAEEIESMGRNDKRALKSHLTNLLMHLLKWEHQPEKRQTSNSWKVSIQNRRISIDTLLEDSPSLKGYLSEIKNDAYQNARDVAEAETGMSLADFPDTCQWALEQVLDRSFFPGEEQAEQTTLKKTRKGGSRKR